MDKNAKFWGLVAAAGAGSRMGGEYPKQYRMLCGKPMLHHALERLCINSGISGTVAGISGSDTFWRQCPFRHDRFLGVYTGGTYRCDTVTRGLHELLENRGASESDWAVVHDAARPCVLQTDINLLLNEAAGNQSGAVLGTRVVDTIKRTNDHGIVIETINRDGFWRALTPQVFRIGELLGALNASRENGLQITDECMAMELAGANPVMVQGSPLNIKVTVSGDLEIAEVYLGKFQ